MRKTIRALNVLPGDMLTEVAAFAFKKQEELVTQKGIEKLVEQSQAFHFLNDEEDLYSVEDIKEKY